MSTITLPKAVEDFVAANNAHDADALAAVFTDGAVVHDDGKTFTGEAEVSGWVTVAPDRAEGHHHSHLLRGGPPHRLFHGGPPGRAVDVRVRLRHGGRSRQRDKHRPGPTAKRLGGAPTLPPVLDERTSLWERWTS
jgi:hypothetical protein